MTSQQRDELDALLRDGPMDLAGDLAEQRALFEEMTAAQPLPGDVRTEAVTLGGVPATAVEIDGTEPGAGTVLYLHGGAYVQGSAATALGLASDLARRAGLRAVLVDYRLAPEHPYPAALDDATAAYRALVAATGPERLVVAGESAGGGLALATLIAARDAGDPLPAAAAVFSPWADLTLSGETMTTLAAVDPSVTEAGLRLRAGQYTGEVDARTPTVSPVFGDLTGLPPLLVQAGGHEVLLDDALRVAAAAARAGVAVDLQVTPGVPHVFPAFAAILVEGAVALDAAARFLHGHLTTTVPATVGAHR